MGALIIEGKTKQVYDLPSMPGHCILLSKDRITAGDGVKAHNLVGKSVISNKTTCKVFEILSNVGKFDFSITPVSQKLCIYRYGKENCYTYRVDTVYREKSLKVAE